MCRDVDGNLLTSRSEVIERWKQHYDEYLIGDIAENKGEIVTDSKTRTEDIFSGFYQADSVDY